MRYFPWFGFLMTVVIIAFIAGLGWIIWLDIDGNRQECHRAGGHIINVNSNEVCVDHDNRVILL